MNRGLDAGDPHFRDRRFTAPYPEVDRSASARRRLTEQAAAGARAIVDTDLVAEHRSHPLGQHSDRLQRLVTWLTMVPTGRRLVILMLREDRFVLAALGGLGHQVLTTDGARIYETRDQAEHAVFQRRLEDLVANTDSPDR
jgi:branched-chain amino acid transport system permease protein